MSVVITDELLKNARISEQEFRLELAIFLFEKEIFTLGKASKFAGIHRIKLQKELAKRKIPVHYDYQEYLKDKETVEQMSEEK